MYLTIGIQVNLKYIKYQLNQFWKNSAYKNLGDFLDHMRNGWSGWHVRSHHVFLLQLTNTEFIEL